MARICKHDSLSQIASERRSCVGRTGMPAARSLSEQSAAWPAKHDALSVAAYCLRRVRPTRGSQKQRGVGAFFAGMD